MKKVLVILNFLCLIALGQAQVGINTTTPNSHAALDINSQIATNTYGGMMPPKITIAQRDAMTLTSADDGLLAYVTLANGDRCLQLYNGSTLTWESIKCITTPVSTPGVVFLETFGTPAATTLVSAYETSNGFDNDGFTFSSSSSPEVDLRTSTVSNTTGASGSGNAFFGTATSNIRNLLIDGISATSYTSPLTLQILINKSTTASDASELIIEYYNSATASWVSASTTLPTGAGTASGTWYERVLSTTVPNTITQIRISKTAAIDFRIDDIKLYKP